MESPTDARSQLFERVSISPEYGPHYLRSTSRRNSRRSTLPLKASAQYLLSGSFDSISSAFSSAQSSSSSASGSSDSIHQHLGPHHRAKRTTTLQVTGCGRRAPRADIEDSTDIKTQTIIRRLSSGSKTAEEDALHLESRLCTHAISTNVLLPCINRLCTSQQPFARAAGYRLIAKICTVNRPLSHMDVQCLWTFLCPLMEQEGAARAAQIKAVELLMVDCDILTLRAGIFNQLVRWSLAGTECDAIISNALSDYQYPICEEQMHQFFSTICRSLSTLINELRPNQECITVLEKDIIRYLSFLSCAHDHDVLPVDVLSNLVQTLCSALHCIKFKIALHAVQGASAPRLENEIMTAISRLMDDPTHGYISLQAIREALLPIAEPENCALATGALLALERCLLVNLSASCEDIPANSNTEGSARSSLSIVEVLHILEQVPRCWMGRTTGEELLCALCLLVERVSQSCSVAQTLEVTSSIGTIVKALVPLIQSCRDQFGGIYTLSLHRESRAPSRVIYQLQRVLTVLSTKRDMFRIEPPIDVILLSLGNHLDDKSLHETIISLKRRGLLDPSLADWKHHFCSILELFTSRIEGIPSSRRCIASYLSHLYDTLAELESPYMDIVDEIISAWEQILPSEEDEEILMAGFHILSTEIILSFDKGTSAAARIRHVWTNLALRENSPCFRRILAVKFLIKAFNNIAFRSPQAFRVIPRTSDPVGSHFAAEIAISLYQHLLWLVGMLHDSEGKVTVPRINCPQARLVLLQWLLRLRSGARHRIHTAPWVLTEVIPLAKLIRRAKEEETRVPNLLPRARVRPPVMGGERRNNVEERRKNPIMRLFARSSTPVPLEVADDDLGRRSPPCSDSVRSSSFPELLWSLPEAIPLDLFEGTALPIPVTGISTYASHKDEKQGHWLPVSSYLKAINDILEFDTEWEIVSYILCHLPLQLANQHFFCGPKVDPEIQHLARVICSAVFNDNLYHRMKIVKPSKADKGGIIAVLYSSLTVLVSYRRRFAPEGALGPSANEIKQRIVECFVEGIGTDLRTSRPCFEALSMVIYAMPETIGKYTALIVEKLSRIMSTRGMAIHIIEFLVLLGLNRWLYTSSFRTADYQRVYGAALIYIEEHYRRDVATFKTSDGRESFSLAQHLLIAAYLVIQTWFMRMKLEDRARFIPFISSRLIRANGEKYPLRPTTTVCLDWLSRYTYGNTDPKVTPSYMYQSIICPQVPDGWRFNARQSWRDRSLEERKNIASVKAWKLGNSIITVSVLKEPEGWMRIICRRPSCLVELVCHLEGQRLGIPSDPPHRDDGPREDGAPQTQSPTDVSVEGLITDMFGDLSDVKDLDKPDPITGLTPSGQTSSGRKDGINCDPSFLAPLLVSYPFHESRRLRRFPDYNALCQYLELIDRCPVLDTYKVAVLYVGPGQTSEAEILSNRYGSPSYSQFISNLGRVIKPNDNLEVYTAGLQPDLHGEYALAWWDDIGQILFHVATFMPNKEDNLHKKKEIGNDAVKIIWNDGGKPYEMNTIPSEFNLVNFIIEPHTQMPKAVYQGGWPWHANSFFKVLIQTHSSVPIVTPIGDFKIVSAEHLPRLIRHYALLATHFCRSWIDTGRDQPPTQPLVTNWQQRLYWINKTDKLFASNPDTNVDSYYVPS
ncbi:Tuberous sclerosis 2-like protein [Serendipita sp. 396]|nr:Tuberous sclerosis 2-like protein [Serendipita sp. 396]KAG8788510.1 Tuberous sclerosis 2-like protein [Serendipita sp. 397]KAG8875007.1 Tuberous sclerosis 2-like protein [Serendipita sp. 405]